MEIIIALITNAIKEAKEKHHKTRFLVDGFPREIHQADIFEETVVESKFILYFEASKETLLKRLLKRGESSGRADDNIDSIKKRFRTFEETSYPVIEKYILQDKVKKINAEQDVEDVYQQVKTVFDPLFR
ncbi:adenylate kinase-domain-containing protein [Spinellus fusiger]|nr:adenylate kinase-domain-containing protein [Spinellus fusiger]